MSTLIRCMYLALFGLLAACSPAPATKSEAAPNMTTSASLRIGIMGAPGGVVPEGCQAAPQDISAKAYVDHLQSRLEKPVQLCGFKDGGAAALALKSGAIEMALLDGEGFSTIKDEARSILAPRFDPTIGRVLAVGLALKTSGRDDVSKLTGAKPIFIGTDAPSRIIPLQSLTDHNVDVKALGPEVIVAESAGLKTLQSGGGDVLIVTAGARQRMCRTENPKGGKCPNLVEFWRGRPTAPKAFVVANALSEADRYQLIGIHIAMHTQNPAAFGFISSLAPRAVMLDPTEPTALLKGTR